MSHDDELSERIHEMISEANNTTPKVFYYSEEEVIDILKKYSEEVVVCQIKDCPHPNPVGFFMQVKKR